MLLIINRINSHKQHLNQQNTTARQDKIADTADHITNDLIYQNRQVPISPKVKTRIIVINFEITQHADSSDYLYQQRMVEVG